MTERPVALTPPPSGYADWLVELKARIHSAQQRAALAVNRERGLLYWQIGRDILERQGREGWGAKGVDRRVHDLRAAFPDMKGFSPRNLKCMRSFAQAWPAPEFVQEVLAPLPCQHPLALLNALETDMAAEYALGDSTQPMGIAEYRLLESLPEHLQTSLPSIEQIEQELTGPHAATDDEEHA